MLNRVPEKVPEKVPGSLGAKPSQVQQGSGEVLEKVGEALVQSQVRFNRVPEKVPEKVAQSQVRLIRVPQNIPEKVWEALVQSQLRVNRVPEKVPGGFGAEPGQVQQVSGEGSGKVWCRARSGSTGFRRIFWRRFQEALNECNAKSGSTGSGECYRSQARWGSFSSRKASWGVSSQHASERFIKIKRCGCWGYHRSLFQTPIKNATTIPVEPHPPVNLQKIVVFHGKPYSPKKTTTVSCSDVFFFVPPKEMNPGSLGPWSKDGSRSLALPTRSQGRKAHSRDRNRRGRAFLGVLRKTMVPQIFPFNPVTCWFKKRGLPHAFVWKRSPQNPIFN